MISVGTYEAKTQLSRLLRQVEKGRSITITKHGKPIATLSPAREEPKRDVKTVIDEFRAYSKRQARTRADLDPGNQRDDRGGTALSKKKGVAKSSKEGLVIDSSVAIAWCFADERDDYSQSVLDAVAFQPAFVPDLWHLEVANTLVVGERRKRSTQAETIAWLNFLAELPLIVDEETKTRAFADITNLARSHNLSAYDAAYLELALRRGLPLATLDEKLRTAAKAVGVALYDIH